GALSAFRRAVRDQSAIERAKPARWVHSEDAVAMVRQNRRHAGQRLVGKLGVRGMSSRMRNGALRPLDRVHDPMVTAQRLPRNRDSATNGPVVTMTRPPKHVPLAALGITAAMAATASAAVTRASMTTVSDPERSKVTTAERITHRRNDEQEDRFDGA